MLMSFNARALGLKLSADETLRLASENGFDSVDLMVRDALEEGERPRDLRRRMDDLGLKGGAFPLPFDWRGDEARFADDLRRLPRYAEAAAELGLVRTGTWVLPETGEARDGEATLAFHVGRLTPVVKTLSECGIRLGLEVIGVQSSRSGRGEPFVHRLDQVEPLRRAIEGASGVEVGVLVDSWHLYAADEPIANALVGDVARVVWVHVADLPAGAWPDRSDMVDSVRGLPGEHGSVDSLGLLRELQARGYDGPVTAEPLGSCRSLQGLPPEAAAARVAESLRSVWPVPRSSRS